MKTLNTLIALALVVLFTACNESKSLEKYYVESQEEKEFMAVDVPTSMFANLDAMDADQRETMNSIKKINVLALRADQYPEKFQKEKANLDEILSDDKYQLLMKYGGGNRKAELYFTGEEDAIDELIVYGYDDDKGLGVARLLGKDMNPAKIMKFLKSLDKEDINLSGLEGFAGFMGDDKNERNKDSIKVEVNISDSIRTEIDSL